MDNLDTRSALTLGRRKWKPPTLKMVGMIGEVLEAGGSKITPNLADPGDSVGKPPGHA